MAIDPQIKSIRIVKGTKTFHVHGDQQGAEGVYLAADQVHGLYESLVKVTYKTGAFQEGARQKAVKWLASDLNLGFYIRDTTTEYDLNESAFRQIFEYELDPWDPNPPPTTIIVETNMSSIRKLDVLMYEPPDFDPDIDPMLNQFGNYIFKLRAGQPFWYEDDVVSSFSSAAGSATGVVTASNPTDHRCFHKWVLTRGTWYIPDFQWVGAKGARAPGGPNGARVVSNIVVSDANGGAVIDLDRQELMFRDANDTNILGQLAGQFFNYEIPPYTPATNLYPSYVAAPAGGAMIQLIMPRHWSRPWGLELV